MKFPTMTTKRLVALRQAAINVLKSEPERHKRERIYQTMCEDDTDPRVRAIFEELRTTLGDTDNNRDTRDHEA